MSLYECNLILPFEFENQIYKQRDLIKMSSFRDSIVIISSAFLVMALFIKLDLVESNVELDNLALQFRNGFDLMSKNTGLISDQQNVQTTNIGEADKKMKELYTVLERNLMEARQRAANARSSVTFDIIEKLSLV